MSGTFCRNEACILLYQRAMKLMEAYDELGLHDEHPLIESRLGALVDALAVWKSLQSLPAPTTPTT